MEKINLTLTCDCGNTATRTQETIVDKNNPKFNIETPYDTGTEDVITGINVICNVCGSRLELLQH